MSGQQPAGASESEVQESNGAPSERNGGVTPTPGARAQHSDISPDQTAGSSRMTRGTKQLRAALGGSKTSVKAKNAFEVMFAGSKASQVRAECEVAKVTADELKSKPNAVLRRTSKEPSKDNIKQRVAQLDGMTVFSALKLNLPRGVGVHGGVYTATDMKYDIECGYLVLQIEGADEPTASEIDGGDAGGSGGLTAGSASRLKRKAPAKVKVEPGIGEDNKEGGTKRQKVRLRHKPRKPREAKKRKSAQGGATQSNWYVLLVLFLVLHPSNHGRQTKRAIQTGAVLSSPPLSEVQAAQCEATACALGFLPRVCVCVNCAGHALMVNDPKRKLAAVEKDRDKFPCNEEGDGHDKQRKVIARAPRPAPTAANTKQEVAFAISLCCVRVHVFSLHLSIYIYILPCYLFMHYRPSK